MGILENNHEEHTTKIALKFDDLTIWTPEEKLWYRRKPTKHEVILLNHVSGCIRAGELVAILGPSGAGKTTLLVSLAGKLTLPGSGEVTINGVKVKDLPKGLLEIVPQFEVFMDSISVAEHLRFMTEMKLGSYDRPENRLLMETLMEELMLKKLRNNTIKSLSGGEKRLLSIATSLISHPKILFLDEPTTGLDSYNAALVVSVLKKLTQKGMMVICSIHQPSSNLFKEFNSIILMAEGKLAFHGSQDDCKAMFESLNHHCPLNYNPAEFYVKAISTDPLTDTSQVAKIAECYNKLYNRYEDSLENRVLSAPTFKLIRRNWCKQVSLLLWRSSLCLKHEIKGQIIQLAISMMISGVIIGTCYRGIKGTTQTGIQDMQGFLWVLSSDIVFALSYNAQYAFNDNIHLFRREIGLYSLSAFLTARFLAFIPKCIIWSTGYVMLTTPFVQLPNHMLTAVEIILALIYTSVASTAYGLGIGAFTESFGVPKDFMSCIDTPLMLVAGGFLRLSSVPVWIVGIKYMSQFFYSLDALSNIYWRQIMVIDCPADSIQGCVADGASYLRENGFSSNFVLVDCLGFSLIIVWWYLIAYYALKREAKKGYAY